MVYQSLSPERIKEVLSELYCLLPNREIFPVCNDKPLELEEIINREPEEGSSTFRIYVEKLAKEEIRNTFNPVFKGTNMQTFPEMYESQAENEAEKELLKVIRAMKDAGTLINWQDFDPENLKGKEYWTSSPIMFPDIHIKDFLFIKLDSEAKEFYGKNKEALLIQPGFYFRSGKGIFEVSLKGNDLIQIIELEPDRIFNHFNLCKVCHGEKYKEQKKVKFLSTGDGTLACEYCVPEFLDKLGCAFKKFKED